MAQNHVIIHNCNGHYGKKCLKGHGHKVQRSQNLTFHTFFTVMAIIVVNNYVILCCNGPLLE